jgi:hypothetical protein
MVKCWPNRKGGSAVVRRVLRCLTIVGLLSVSVGVSGCSTSSPAASTARASPVGLRLSDLPVGWTRKANPPTAAALSSLSREAAELSACMGIPDPWDDAGARELPSPKFANGNFAAASLTTVHTSTSRVRAIVAALSNPAYVTCKETSWRDQLLPRFDAKIAARYPGAILSSIMVTVEPGPTGTGESLLTTGRYTITVPGVAPVPYSENRVVLTSGHVVVQISVSAVSGEVPSLLVGQLARTVYQRLAGPSTTV